MSQTFADNLLPSASGYDLGAALQRWDIYAQNLDVSGTATFSTLTLTSLEGIQFADNAAGASVTAKIDAALGAAATVAVLVPSTMGAGNASAIAAGKSILDLRAGYPKWFTNYSISSPAWQVNDAGVTIMAAAASNTANVSATGQFRLANSDAIKVRNSGNTADLNLVSMSGNVVVLGDVGGVSVSGPLSFSGALSGITTLSMSGVLTSTLATGTAPLAITSTTVVPNLSVALLNAVAVSAVAPTANQVLQASSATAASWQTISGTGYTYSASNKRWELFDSTITTWLQDVQPGYRFNSDFRNHYPDTTNDRFYAERPWGGGANYALYTAPNGALRITTIAGANDVQFIEAFTATEGILGSDLQCFWFVCDPVQSDANTTQRVGFTSDGASTDPPANGIYLERLGADANWFLVTRAAAAETRSNTAIAHAAGKIGFIVVKNGTTNVKVYQAGSATALATNSATIPADATLLTPFFQVKTLAAAIKSFDAHLFRATGKSVTAGY